MNVFITSGYFNPLHEGHCALFKDISKIKKEGDKFIVIVNNDGQQVVKKGKIIMSQYSRKSVIESIKDVDEAVLSSDTDMTVCDSIKRLHKRFNEYGASPTFWFVKGGDRNNSDNVPEVNLCNELGIKVLFGIGGFDKKNSSTDINKARGAE